MIKVLVVCGPTATGKTSLAVALAKQFDGELISADSRQVYKGMDLTTGKERADVPIWLYDVVRPDEEFSVNHWVQLARAAVMDIHARGKLSIIVGGTGLYIQALLAPFETIDIPPNNELREKLQKLPVQDVQKMVPRGNMNNSDWNNPRRLIRKIEIQYFIRPPLMKQWEALDMLQIGLTAPLAVLDERIDKRLLARKAAGLDEEVARLRKKFKADLPAMSAIGLNEHAYARRQMTWFKKQHGIHWFDVSKPDFKDQIAQVVLPWYTT